MNTKILRTPHVAAGPAVRAASCGCVQSVAGTTRTSQTKMDVFRRIVIVSNSDMELRTRAPVLLLPSSLLRSLSQCADGLDPGKALPPYPGSTCTPLRPFTCGASKGRGGSVLTAGGTDTGPRAGTGPSWGQATEGKAIATFPLLLPNWGSWLSTPSSMPTPAISNSTRCSFSDNKSVSQFTHRDIRAVCKPCRGAPSAPCVWSSSSAA